MSDARIVVIRAARVFCQTLVAALTAGNLTGLTGIAQGVDLRAALVLAGGASLISALQNMAELFGELDKRAPQWRA